MNVQEETRISREELYISVDVETAGPIPYEYSMLSIGASVVGLRNLTFYAELIPINDHFVPDALAIAKFSLQKLAQTGRDPKEVMAELDRWVTEVSLNRTPVMIGFNASFDWQFVNWYFHKFLGRNPFGIGAIDIKAYYMGMTGCKWAQTSSSQLPLEFRPPGKLTHRAVDDAVVQAEIFEKLRSSGGNGAGNSGPK